MNKIVLLLTVLLMIIFSSGCTSNERNSDEKLNVVVSFYPLYDFTKNIAGDRLEVTTLIPAGVEPHNFEPSPSAIQALASADIFIYNGAEMEPWANGLIENIGNQELIVVDTSDGVELIRTGAQENGTPDPHIWLDPILAKHQVIAIKNALIRADPEGKDYYENKTSTYLEKLDSLDAKFRATMTTCKKKQILIAHATLAYFCKRYGCEQIPITGIDPEAEPSPSDLVSIIEQAKENNVSAVFFESLINPKSAQVIANEINGSVIAFNSIHGLSEEERASGEDYVSLMEENLENIKKALECNYTAPHT